MNDHKSMDNDVILYLKQGDKKRNEVFLLLKQKYGEEMTDRQRGYVLERLQREGLVMQKRYGIYGLSEEGQRRSSNLPQTIYDEPNLEPVLMYLPLEAQKAGYRLGLDAVVSKYLLKEDEHNWLGLVLAGDTKDGKSQLARAIAWTFRFHRKGTVFYLQHTLPGELGVRRFPKGKGKFGIHVSPALAKPLLILENYDKIKNKDTARNVKYLLEGERILEVEGERFRVDPVPIVLFNLREGEDFQYIERELGREYIRRSIVMNTKFLSVDYRKMDELGRKLIKLEKKESFPHIALSNLKIEKKSSSEKEFNLLEKLIYNCVKDATLENIIDTNYVAHLVLGRLSWCHKFDLEETVRQVAYDFLLTRETLGILKDDWRNIFWKKSDQSGRPKEKETFPEAEPTIKIDKKGLGRLKGAIKFQEEYKEELSKLKKLSIKIKEFEKFLQQENITWKRIGQIFFEEGYKLSFPKTCQNAIRKLEKEYNRIQEGDWENLGNFKEANNWLNEAYIKPLIGFKERIKLYKKIVELHLSQLSNVEKISQIPPITKNIDKSLLPPGLKRELKELTDKKEIALEKGMRALEEKHLAKIRKADNFSHFMEAYELMVADSACLSEELNLELAQALMEKYRRLSIEIKQNLISCLRREQAPTKDITQDLIALGLLKGVTTISGHRELKDINGRSYGPGEFDFSKYKAKEDWLTIGRCKEEALSLLTSGVEEKTLVVGREYRQKVSKDLGRYTIDKAGDQPKKTKADSMQGDLALQALVEWAGKKMKNWWETQQQITKPIGTAEFFDSKINRLFKVQIWNMNIDTAGVKRYEVKFRDKAMSSTWVEASQLRNISISVKPNKQTDKTRPTQSLETTAPLGNPKGKAQLLHGGDSPWWGEAQVWNEKDDELGNKRYCVTWDGQTEPVWVHYSQIRKVLWFNH